MRVRIKYQCTVTKVVKLTKGNHVTLYSTECLFKKETVAKGVMEQAMKSKLSEGYEFINKTCMRKGNTILNFFIQKVRVLDN